MQKSAFNDSYTVLNGSTYYIQIESVFTEQVSELINFLSRSKSEDERQALITQIDQLLTDLPVDPIPEAEINSEDPESPIDLPKQPDSPALLAAKQTIITTILVSLSAPLLAPIDAQFEASIHSLTSLIHATFPVEKKGEVLRQLAKLVAQGAPTNGRYAALLSIVNSLEEGDESLALIEILIKYALSNKDIRVLEPLVQQTALFNATLVGLLADGLVEANEPERAVELLERFLTSPQSESTTGTQRDDLVLKLYATILTTPSLISLPSLVSIPAPSSITPLITALQTSSTVTGELVPQSLKVDVSVLDRKAKIMSVGRICATRVGENVSLDEIAKELGVSVDEVDGYIIEAIKASLIRAKISHPTRSLTVYGSKPVEFGAQEWIALRERLVECRERVGRIRQMIPTA